MRHVCSRGYGTHWARPLRSCRPEAMAVCRYVPPFVSSFPRLIFASACLMGLPRRQPLVLNPTCYFILLFPHGHGNHNAESCTLQVVRLKESLEGMGFSVVHEDGPWDWEGMMERHVRKTPGQEDVQLATTGNEAGEMSTHLLSIMWAPIPCKTGG